MGRSSLNVSLLFSILLFTILQCALVCGSPSKPNLRDFERENFDLNVSARNAGMQDQNTTVSTCLPRFNDFRKHFEPCKKDVCFLFLNQAPFVILDPDMTSPENQTLFPCKNRKKLFPQLDGIAFQLHQELNLDNAQCVWAGSRCTFNEVVKFVSDRAQDNSTKAYMFGVTGLVAQLPSRVSLDALTTVTLYESEIIILRSNTEHSGEIKGAFSQVFRGFELGTWLVLAGFLVLLLLLALFVSITFTQSCSTIDILMHAIGDHHEAQIPEHLERGDARRSRRAFHRASTLLLGIAFSAFVLITILFYEISVVNFIFNEQAEQLPKPLSEYSDKELSRFSVLRNATPENVLRRAVDNTGKRFKGREYPWYQCSDDKDCYDKMLDPRDPVQYMVVFSPEGMYNIKTRLACNKLTQYATSEPLSLFSGGWYLGASVPPPMRLKINQEILRLKMSGKMRHIIEEGTGVSDKSCGAKKLTIQPSVLSIPLLFIIGPIVLVIIVLLFCGCRAERRERRREERSEIAKSFWETIAVPPPVDYSPREYLP